MVAPTPAAPPAPCHSPHRRTHTPRSAGRPASSPSDREHTASVTAVPPGTPSKTRHGDVPPRASRLRSIHSSRSHAPGRTDAPSSPAACASAAALQPSEAIPALPAAGTPTVPTQPICSPAASRSPVYHARKPPPPRVTSHLSTVIFNFQLSSERAKLEPRSAMPPQCRCDTITSLAGSNPSAPAFASTSASTSGFITAVRESTHSVLWFGLPTSAHSYAGPTASTQYLA